MKCRDYVDHEVGHLREMIEVRLAAADKALNLQAREYDRRLGDLNHENARVAHAQARSVSVEVFDGYKNTQASEMRGLRDTVIAEAAARSTRVATYGTGFSLFLIVLGWLVSWLTR